MRYGAFLLMLSLLLGTGTARAQSPGIFPAPVPTEAKPAIRHVKRKPVAAKPAPAKTSDVKLPPAKPAAVIPAEVKLPVAKPTEAKAAPKAIAVKPATPEKTAAAAPAVPNAPAAKAEVTPDAGIASGERSKIQAALLWSGDYTGAAGGDDPMVTAIKNFQKRHKAKITGELSPSERADLIAAAKAHEAEFGWSVVVDPATGIRIGLPAKLVPQARDAARGTRWSSAHGEVQVETFRISKPGLTLAALFEQEKTQPATRRVETSALHDDNFFIGGMQGLKMFSVRAKMRDGEIRGFSILYDQMMESIVAPAVAAMASAFSPFPERSAPYAALARSVEYGTGLVVSAQGHIVTDLRLAQGCQVIVAAGLGNADRVAEDPDNGLALLRVYGQRKISSLALPHDAPDGGKPRDVTLVGIPDPKEQDGSRKLTEIKARLSGGSAIELRQPVPMAGFSGAAALDARGQFLGMMAMSQAVLASVEASAPPVRLISAETIRGFLAAHHVAAAPAPSADAKASVVRVICVRK